MTFQTHTEHCYQWAAVYVLQTRHCFEIAMYRHWLRQTLHQTSALLFCFRYVFYTGSSIIASGFFSSSSRMSSSSPFFTPVVLQRLWEPLLFCSPLMFLCSIPVTFSLVELRFSSTSTSLPPSILTQSSSSWVHQSTWFLLVFLLGYSNHGNLNHMSSKSCAFESVSF